MNLELLLIEPFGGGSHAVFMDQLAARSRHRISRIDLPARFWKWRMRSAPLSVATRLADLPEKTDVILAGSMLDLATLRGLAGPLPPTAVYFHENQFDYPNRVRRERDAHFAFTNFTTALAADACWFNSRYHLEAFFEGLGVFLRKMPDEAPLDAIDAIREKSFVVYPGVIAPQTSDAASHKGPPVLLWNHRHEHDKHPEEVFEPLLELADEGVDYRLILLGERFARQPAIFQTVRRRLADRILHDGFCKRRRDYEDWLGRADIVLSAAGQENFGFSVAEAILAGAWPLLPHRLVYPELIPEALHPEALYGTREEFKARLTRWLKEPEALQQLPRKQLTEHYRQFGWNNRIDEFDDSLERLAGLPQAGGPKRS